MMRVNVLLAVLVCACATTSSGGGGATDGGIGVALRRIDVHAAGYDQMELDVVFAVENGSANDLDIDGAINIGIAGRGDEEDAVERKDNTDAGSALDDAGGGDGVDGTRYTGKANGRASAGTTSELPVRITVPLPTDIGVLERMLSWPKMKIDVKGVVNAAGKAFPFDGVRDIAPPRLPQVTLKTAQIAKVGGDEAGEAFFTLLVENRNAFGVKIDKLQWKVTIKDKVVKESDTIVGGELPANSVEEYNESIELNQKMFPQKELKALLKQPSVGYVLEGSCEVRGIVQEFRFTGDMNFPR
jgi:LEA14-like dessication related protein